jgi:glycosyltransferase involved in cell wall biosynthesis
VERRKAVLSQDLRNSEKTGILKEGSVPAVSIVIPIYNEEENISDLVDSVVAGVAPVGKSSEILLVDDGSTDRTAAYIRDVAKKDPRVRGIFLARNYGQSTAMQAGFDEALGEIIITLDGDLQNDPQDIPMMLDLLASSGADLVSGWRVNRKDGPVRKLFSKAANRLISAVTGVRLHDYGCSLKVYRRSILERTRLYGELHRFIPALIAEVGGKTVEVPVRHHPRERGVSKYKLDRTIRVFLDLLLIMFLKRYMQRPLHLFGGIGLIFTAVGSLSIGYLTALKLLTDADIGQRPLLLLGVLCVLLGVIMIGQGLIGEVITRTYFASPDHRQYHLAEEPVAQRPQPNVLEQTRKDSA